MDLRGRISATELAEIFQLLTTTRKEGTLTVSDGVRKKSIYFSRGGVTLLFDRDKRTRSLGQLLVDYGRISEEQLQLALEQQKDSGKRLGEVVRDMGLITDEEIEDLVRSQIEEEIFDLLSWRGGNFYFRDEPTPEVLADPTHSYTSLMFDPNSLLMEAARRMDEWERIGELVRTGQEIFARVQGVRAEVGEGLEVARDRVLPWLDGGHTAEDIVQQARLPKFEVYSVLYQLHQVGAAEITSPEDLNRQALETIDAGNLDRGIYLLSSALAQVPADLDIRKDLGKAYDVAGQRERALELYGTVVSEYLRRGGVPEARPVLDRMEQLSPDSPQVLALETSLALVQGETAEAIQRCLSLVRTVEQQGGCEAAKSVIDEVLQVAPEHVELREAVADMLAASDQTLGAVRQYERVAELHLARGGSHYARGVYRRILQLDPDHTTARQQLEALGPELKGRSRRRPLTVLAVAAVVLVVGVGWWWFGRSSPEEPDGPVPPVGDVNSPGDSPPDDAPPADQSGRAEQLAKEARALEAEGRISEALARWEEAAALAPADGSSALYQGKARRLSQLLGAARAQLDRARSLEQQGDYEGARREYLALCVRYDFAVKELAVALPVPVRTLPKGVEVVVDGQVQGSTPMVLHLPPFRAFSLSLETRGHEAFQTTITSDTVAEVVKVLPRQSNWEYRLRAGLTAGPGADGERVYVVGGDRVVRALGAADGSDLWQVSLESQVTASPVSAGGVLVLAARDGTVYGLNSATGEESWRFPAGDAFRGSPRYVDSWGSVFLGGLDKKVYCLDAQTGEERWTFPTSGNVEASPTVAGDLVLCGSLDGKLYALAAATGELRWKLETGGPVARDVTVAGGTAYLVTLEDEVMACSLAAGEERWRRRSPERVVTGVWAVGGSVCYGTAKNEVVGLDAEEGAVRWRVTPEDEWLVSLCGAGDRLWVGGGRGALVCLDGVTGEVLWKAKVEGAAGLPPWVGEGRLYVATSGGVWCFEP